MSRLRSRPALERLEERLAPATLPSDFREALVAGGLVRPTAMELAPDGRIFVTEQDGTVRVVRDGAVQPTPFVSLNVNAVNERGLLGITFDPDFATNRFVYLYYTAATTPPRNRVSRFTAAGDVAAPGSEVILLDLGPLNATNHNGGAIHFGLDGKLYVGVGENAFSPNAQSFDNLLGKLLRINPDGTIPTDNPFFATAQGVNRVIWALGLRNPFTFAVQPGTGRIFINDVGATAFEEINDGVAGGNYGWPNAEGPAGNPASRDPVFAYPRGPGNTAGFAIAGGAFYNPAAASFPAEYVGDYFFADWANKWVRRLDPANGSVTLFASDLPFGTVDLKVDPAGRLYYLSRGTGDNTGVLFRVEHVPVAAEQRFVAALFRDGLGRAASAAEVDAWAGRLADLGRTGVAAGILRSREALARLVRGYYGYFLGRAADAAGEALWVGQLGAGSTAEQVAAAFLGSSEFAARANALEGTADPDANFVRSLYRLVLRRAAGAAEVEAWLRVLPSAGRGSVAAAFLGSAEFRGDAVRAFYGVTAPAPLPFFPNLLKRRTPPGAAEVLAWVVAPLDLLSIETAIAASAEYFANG